MTTELANVCILGASGNLGSRLRRFLRTLPRLAGVQLTFVDPVPIDKDELGPLDRYVNLSSAGRLENALEGVDCCVNLAARIFAHETRPAPRLAELLSASVGPIREAFEVIRPCVTQWIQVSSISVYEPSRNGLPITEHHALVPPSAYGVAKLAAEIYLQVLEKTEHFCLQILRLCDIYGGSSFGTEDQRTLPSLLRAWNAGEAWSLFGSGDTRRDLLHVDDAARAISLALLDPTPGTWNVGSGDGVSTRELIETLTDLVGDRPPIEVVAAGEGHDHLLDASAFSEAFGFRPRVELWDGLDALLQATGVPTLPRRD